MYNNLQGRCGLYCGHCSIYMAYSTSNREALQKIASEINKTQDKMIKPEDVKCLGCKSPAVSCWNSTCEIRNCADERGIEFCYQCRVYPCDIIQNHLEKHPQARENMRTISKIGPYAWLTEMMTKSVEGM